MKIYAIVFLLFTNSLALATQKLEQLFHFKRATNDLYNDVWGYADEQGNEYALLGVRNGTSVVQLHEDRVEEISFIPSYQSIWKDIKTYQNYAYVVNESGGGLQIIDLSELPQRATLVATYQGFQTSHNIFIDEEQGILFAEGNHAVPVRVLSLENPIQPVAIGRFGVECHDIFARNGLAFISEGGHGTIGIFDYSNPNSPTLFKRFQIPQAGYVHNAWLGKNSQYLMTTEETQGKSVKIWDLAQTPARLVGEYLGPNGLAHNAHIKGDYAYISHYGAGLRIVDMSDPTNASEAAYFLKGDHVPNGFVSDWGVYPYLPSNRVLVSDIESGLFVTYFENNSEPSQLRPR